MQHLITAAIAFGAAATALVLVLGLARYLEPVDRGRRRRLEGRIAPCIFLFEQGRLVDATLPARRLMTHLPGQGLDALLAWLAPRLPGLTDYLARLSRDGMVEITGSTGTGSARLTLQAQDLGDQILRVTLTDPHLEGSGVVVDSLSQNALEDEVRGLREAMDTAPVLCWRQAADGSMLWANAAYLQQAEAARPGHPAWPLPKLFDLAPDPDGTAGPQRRELEGPDGNHWFECRMVPGIGGEMLVFASPVDDAVRAERSLREFVQTLTKTFADLTIGLAVFDRDRKLQLFNPALIDLTGLSSTFLAGQPSLFALLDRLREARMVPEPKDYRSWRQKMSTLEAAAASGHHVETWLLPGGQTYRVIGRPHPDGALAFLFEDITSQMSQTRHYRAQLSLGAQVVDTLAEALAVFGPDGQMLLGNEAWRQLWDDERLSLAERLRAFEATIGPGAGVQRLIEVLAPGAVRDAASGAMAGPDGALLAWRTTPLSGGLWMLCFNPNPATGHVAPRSGPGTEDPQQAGAKPLQAGSAAAAG